MGRDEAAAILPDETYERFCKAPGHKCVDYAECYSNKQCQHAPDESSAPPQPCKADVHYGPVTVSGRELRCSNCGYCWGIAHEGPGPK